MKASETKLQRVIEGTNQYVVPLFQRKYSWDSKEWNTLWEDLKELYEEDSKRNHFIGSIVTMPTQAIPEGVAKFLLIDGQQRFTRSSFYSPSYGTRQRRPRIARFGGRLNRLC